MKQQAQEPQGTVVLRTLAMPKDTNGSGDIFGGWLISQMDMAAAIFAMETAQKRVTTVAIDKIIFSSPVQVGDTVCCYTDLLKIGNTSMTIKVEAWCRNPYSQQRKKVTEGIFTFVALDENRKPTAVKGDQ